MSGIYFQEQELTTWSEPTYKNAELKLSGFEVDGTGKIKVVNTGGSSASEGGMGDGGGEEKGAGITESGSNTSKQSDKESFDEKWDPVKPKEIKEKENG